MSQQSKWVGRAKLALVLLCASLAAGLFVGCAQQQDTVQKEPEYKAELIQGDTLKVLIAPDYPPFAAGSGADVWGYDIAVAQEIASRMELQLEFVEAPRAKLLSVLTCEPEPAAATSSTTAVSTSTSTSTSTTTQEPKEPEPQADIAIGALAITPERDDKVDFSSWYCVGDQAVVTLKSAYDSTVDFDSAKTRIAVVKGSTCLDTAKSLTGEKLVAEYSTAQKCLEALQAKEVQAVVLDLPVARYLINHGFSNATILEYFMTGEAYGIAIPSNASHLKDAINDVIAEMEEDGTFDRLAAEYL